MLALENGACDLVLVVSTLLVALNEEDSLAENISPLHRVEDFTASQGSKARYGIRFLADAITKHLLCIGS